MLGGGLWAYLGGVVFDSTGNYDLVLLISAVMAALALVGTVFIREKRHLPPSLGERMSDAPGVAPLSVSL
jgi:predicted MFS family arabinose efflux permease